MSLGTDLQIGIFFLSRGGPSAVSDAVTLTRVYRDIQAKKLTVTAALTDANITAAGVLLTIVAEALQDPAQKASILAMVQGL